MPFITLDQARSAARRTVLARGKSEADLLREARQTQQTSFDIFLSHSVVDREIVLGAKVLLEEKGLTVYVDWLQDPQLDRGTVTSETAAHLRVRMRQSRQLLYLHTPSSALSRWCPWELGYFDAFSYPEERVFILPVLRAGETFVGQEYLALYKAVGIDDLKRLGAVRSGGPGTLDPFDAFRTLRPRRPWM